MNTFESNWTTNNGVAVYVYGWEPDGKPKATIGLVHGLGEHVGRYEHVAKVMTDAGYAMVGFDLHGHGRTGGERGNIPSLESAMQDIRKLLQFISEKYPDLPQFLYGHSLGGLFTLTYAIQYGSTLKGVIVTDAGLRSPLLDQKVKVAMAKMLGSLLPAITISTGLDPTTLSRDPDVVEKYIHDPLVHDKTSMGLAKASMTAIDLCFDHAKEFTPPLLMMHGKADKLTYASGSEDFAKLAGETNKDVTLKLWNGLYHEIHNEPEKADVFKVMVGWLDGHL